MAVADKSLPNSFLVILANAGIHPINSTFVGMTTDV